MKTYLVLFLLTFPLWGLMGASHSGSSHSTRFHAFNFATNIHHTAFATLDDELLVAEDDDGDDLSKVLTKNVSFSEIAFHVVANMHATGFCYSAPGILPAFHSSSFLRVFRI